MSDELNVVDVKDEAVPAWEIPAMEVPADKAAAVVVEEAELASVLAKYPEPQAVLLRWLVETAARNGWSWGEVVKRTQVSRATFSRVYSGTYTNTKSGEAVKLDGICRRIEQFQRMLEERDGIDKAPFVETDVYKRIAYVCRQALVMQTVVIVVGNSQMGKTTSLREYARRSDRGATVLATFPAGGNKTSLMGAIAVACGVELGSFDRMRLEVLKYLNENTLLVIDDIHEVRESCGTKTMLQCLGIIRQLHDMSGCGLVLAGANTFRNHIEEGRFVASMQQLRRRGIWMLQLEDNSTDEDMMLIAGHYGLGLPEGETAKTVRWIGNTMGLGKFCKFLEAASRDAVKRKETMGWEHFDKIYRKSEGLRNPKSLVRGK